MLSKRLIHNGENAKWLTSSKCSFFARETPAVVRWQKGLHGHLKGDIIDPYSAGLEVHGLNPYAIRVMEKIGIDISRQQSKTLDDLDETHFDYVITVCGHADEYCPVFPGNTKVVHRGFGDPPKLAEAVLTEEERLACYRRVRDEIREYIETLPESLA